MCIVFGISTVGCGKKEEIGVGNTETISNEETANVSFLEDSNYGDKSTLQAIMILLLGQRQFLIQDLALKKMWNN